MVARSFAPMFPIDLLEKDFGYVEAAATHSGSFLPTASVVRAVYARAKKNGLGEANIAGLIQLFE